MENKDEKISQKVELKKRKYEREDKKIREPVQEEVRHAERQRKQRDSPTKSVRKVPRIEVVRLKGLAELPSEPKDTA